MRISKNLLFLYCPPKPVKPTKLKVNKDNLLVVEDNPFIGNKIVEAVKTISDVKNIQLSDTIKDAFTFLKDSNYQVITLDLSLPDGNGIEILKWLKENNMEKLIYVFSANTELKQICLRYGASAFFDKADGFDELIETIKVL